MFLGIDGKPVDRLALKDSGGDSLTYGELCDEVRRLQAVLTDRRLAFCLCRNEVGAALGYLAMVDAGVVPVMLSASIKSELLAGLYDTYRPSLVWAPEGLGALSGDAIYRAHGYELLDTGKPAAELNEMLELCMSTSGSTGSPKLARYKRGNLEANAKNVAKAFGWTADERALADLGLQYTMGLNVVNTHLWVGATVLLTAQNIMASGYWDFLKAERATNLTGVPFTYEVFSRLHFTSMDLPDLRTIAEGGGRLSDARFRELAEWASRTKRRFIASFGTTETAARMACLPPELALEKTGSIGRAIPEGELFLVDRGGERLPDGPCEGELCYTGPNVTMGYARSLADLSLGDEWRGTYRTGDLARRDADGCYYITGRLSRFVKLLGYRVSLDECERIVANATGLTCACVGDDNAISVYVEGNELQAEAAAKVVRSTVGLRPSQCRGRAIDLLPRGDSGKVSYIALAHLGVGAQ